MFEALIGLGNDAVAAVLAFPWSLGLAILCVPLAFALASRDAATVVTATLLVAFAAAGFARSLDGREVPLVAWAAWIGAGIAALYGFDARRRTTTLLRLHRDLEALRFEVERFTEALERRAAAIDQTRLQGKASDD